VSATPDNSPETRAEPAGPSRVAPDFLLIGAMKAGTTTLIGYLARHPRVYVPAMKEPGYFSQAERHERGWDWYQSLFRDAEPGQVCGEASTCYSRHPHFLDAASLIAERLPDVRLIYLMRHPVERAYSHYRHDRERLHNDPVASMTFEQAIEADRSIIDASRYVRQIEHYLEHFERERLLLLTTDDLRNDTAALLDRAQAHLGLERHDLLAEGPLRLNESTGRIGVKHRVNSALRSVMYGPGLNRLTRAAPGNFIERGGYRLAKWVARSPVGAAIQRRIERTLPPLSPETRQHLLEVFSESTGEIESMLGRDLSHWKR